MTATPRVMLLIDADNVSADVIEQAMRQALERFGAVHVRRAYCTPESALKQQKLLRELSIRPMVNLAAGKNSTDIALAVDAVDLAIAERPDVAVIVSSDSDFAPLVSRLREKGCRVVGIGQTGKIGGEVAAVYDEFVELAHRARASHAGVARKAAAVVAEPPAGRAAAPRRRARKTAAEAPAAASAPAVKAAGPALPDEARRILDVLPELAAGATLPLRLAAERLRDAGLLGASASTTKLLRRFAEVFELLPPRQPNELRLARTHPSR